MSTDQISFSCDACGVQLTVPASLAGITGPCPSCQASITAPAPEPEPLAPDFSAAPAPPEPQDDLPPPSAPIPEPTPAPVSTAPEPYAPPSARPPLESPDTYELPAPTASAPAISAPPAEPEPYELPSPAASAPVEPIPADLPEPTATPTPNDLPSPSNTTPAAPESFDLPAPETANDPVAVDPFENPPPEEPDNFALPKPSAETQPLPEPKPFESPAFPPADPLANPNGFPAPKSASIPESLAAPEPSQAPAPPFPLTPDTSNGFPAPKSASIPETLAAPEPAAPEPAAPEPAAPKDFSAPKDFPAAKPAELPESFAAPKDLQASIPEPPNLDEEEVDDLPPVLLSNPIEPEQAPDPAPDFQEPSFPPPPTPPLNPSSLGDTSAPSAPPPLSSMPGPIPAAVPTPSAPFPEARPTPLDSNLPSAPPTPTSLAPTPTPLPSGPSGDDSFSQLIPIGGGAPPALETYPAATVPAPVPPVGPLSPGDPPTISQPAPGPPIGAAANRITEPSAKKRRLRWPGVVFPILFLLLAGIVVYLVLDLTGIVNSAALGGADKPNPATSKVTPKHSGGANANATPVSTSPNQGRAKGIEKHDLNANGELPPTPRIDLEATPLPSSPSARITDDPNNPSNILEKFLRAQSLEERLPYMSKSRLSAEELATSSLAIPLPEIVNRRSVHYMENRSERHKEHFFEVFFQLAANERAIPILIQLNDWGDGKVQVHTDAFLDLFDDNLGKFAENPVEGTRTFHVVADAYKHCFDDIIPGWEKKSVLKLRTHPRMAPRMIAYFNRMSAISDEISQPNALPWGESGICTVTVEWNTDTPDQPFVELRRINGFTWNP